MPDCIKKIVVGAATVSSNAQTIMGREWKFELKSNHTKNKSVHCSIRTSTLSQWNCIYKNVAETGT